MRKNRSSATRRGAVVAEEIDRLAPRPGDILLFYHPERFRSRLIAWFTRSPFYHVALYEGGGKVIEARIPEVMRRDLYTQRDGFRFVVVPAPSCAARERALAWARERIGAPYHMEGLAIYIVGRTLHLLPLLCRLLCPRECERFVCGDFVVRAFLAAGITLFPGRHPAEIVPADFACLYRAARRPRGRRALASAA